MTDKIPPVEYEKDYANYSCKELVEAYDILNIVDGEYAGIGKWENQPILRNRKMNIAKELHRRIFH